MCSRVTMWFWILLLMLEPHVYRKVHWNSIWFHTSGFWVVFEKTKSSALITISNPPTQPQWSECSVVHPFCQISGVRWWSLWKLYIISLVRHWMLGTSQHNSQALVPGVWICIPALFVICCRTPDRNVFTPCEMLTITPSVIISRKSESTWNPSSMMP